MSVRVHDHLPRLSWVRLSLLVGGVLTVAWTRWAGSGLDARVVSDVVLPRLDGLGLCARIKDDPDLASTKVVLTTAVYKNVTLKQVMRDSKADAVIEKPIDSAGFLKKVRGLLA